MHWEREHPPVTCCKCHKIIKPGRKMGIEGRFEYCHRCGLNRELVQAHRLEKQLTMPRF